MLKKKSKQAKTGITYISSDCRLVGTLELDSDCMVDGVVEGKVIAKGNVTIEKQGRVEGELTAESVQIAGHFKGKLKCQRVSITSNGMLDGDVLSEKIEIFEGGQFVGSRLKEELPLLEKPVETDHEHTDPV